MTSVCGRVGGPRTVGIPLPPAPPRRLRYSDSLRLASPRPPTGSAALALTVVSPAQLLRPAAARPLQLAGVGRADLLALAILAHRRLKRSSWTELISGPCRRRRSTSTRTPNQVNPDFLMEAATVASSGTGLRCSLNPVPIQQRRSARVGFMTERQPCAVTCRRLLLRLNARPYRAASASAALDSGAGNSGVSRKRLTVFVSGGGSNFRSIHEAALGGEVNGDVVALVTDKPGCGGAEYARCNGIPVVVFPKSKSAPEGVSTDELLNVLRDLKVDFVLLAGYLKLIPGELVQAYPRSMLNIHPSLLPAFGGIGYYGSRVHKAVIASGARYSGPTVHFVDEQFDTGRTLAQRVVPVLANDTPEQLAARVLHEEHQVYVEAVAALCED